MSKMTQSQLNQVLGLNLLYVGSDNVHTDNFGKIVFIKQYQSGALFILTEDPNYDYLYELHVSPEDADQLIQNTDKQNMYAKMEWVRDEERSYNEIWDRYLKPIEVSEINRRFK